MDFVVNGEASETDDETMDENILRKGQIYAAEVSGEETESEEEEIYGKAFENKYQQTYGLGSFSRGDLLQRNLVANNLSIWRSSKHFVRNYVTSSSKTIVSCDQLLVRSQVFLQSVTQALKVTFMDTKKLREQTTNLIALNFIPEISVNYVPKTV